ncbi:MAG: phenylalanine--tRNA ligase subunit alpha [Chloroflexi bacterium]|nr:phenylalanine--tRNA ligase subunit alpha [Chloroflexota bacterium]
MLEKLTQLVNQARSELTAAQTSEQLEGWRLAYLGKKGALTLLLRNLGSLPADQRPEAGRVANEVKMTLESLYTARVEELRQGVLETELTRGALDVHLPGRPQQLGNLHISTQTLREIYAIFGRLGFDILRSPEVEDDYTNFQLLNIPQHHPARDMWSTFYTDLPGVILRTHTSPGQIYAMRKYYPQPFRVILPGKCYRYEQVSSRSEQMFYQVEAIAVGENITMSDLKGVLTYFARSMFGADRKVRLRPSYFPFTEPSAEVDIECFLCQGQGCPMCKHSGWLEILGSGMIHPQVLRNGGYDPDRYTGFALGMGPERIAILKHGITDIRYFFNNDMRFLQQFA